MFPDLRTIGFLEDRPQCALTPLFIVGVFPVITRFGIRMLHFFFVLGLIETTYKVFAVAVAEVTVLHADTDEVWEFHFEGVAEIHQITQRFCEGIMSGTDSLFTEVACLSNGHWVAKRH